MKEEKNTVDERVQFLESLNKLVEMGKKKDGKINFSDINEQFKDIDLDGDKTEKILDYLEQNGIIAILPDTDADEDIILDVDDEPTEEELENYGFGAGAQMIENEVQTENAQQEIVLENVSRENHMHEEDLTLIQGIIDVFWIEDDGITVLDYKTDRVDTAQELIDRYATQLKLYADALERVFAARKMKVKEILIYSFRLEKLISIE